MYKRILCFFLCFTIFTTSFSFLNITEVKATGVIEGAAAWALEDAIFSALMTLAFYCGVDGSSAFDYDEEDWYNPDTSSIEDLTEYRNKNKRAFKVILGGGGKLPNDDFDLKETLSVNGALDAFLHTLDSDRDAEEIALVNQLKERIDNDPNYLEALYKDFGESAVNGFLNIDKAFVDMNIYNSSVNILPAQLLSSDTDKFFFDLYRSKVGERAFSRSRYEPGQSFVYVIYTSFSDFSDFYLRSERLGFARYFDLTSFSSVSGYSYSPPTYSTNVNLAIFSAPYSLSTVKYSTEVPIVLKGYGQPDSIENGKPLTSNIIDVKELLTNDVDGKLQIKPNLDNDPEAVPKAPQVVNYQTINNYNKQILQGEKTFPDTVPDVVKQTNVSSNPNPDPDTNPFNWTAPKDLRDFLDGVVWFIPDFIKVIIECLKWIFELPQTLSHLGGG